MLPVNVRFVLACNGNRYYETPGTCIVLLYFIPLLK